MRDRIARARARGDEGAALVLALIVGLAREYAMHRVAALAVPGRLIAPAGVAFASDGRTPVVITG
jgi:hypothetical protein